MSKASKPHQPLSEYGLKMETCQFSTSFLVSPTEKERKHIFVRVQTEYGFNGLVVSTVWIGSEYGFSQIENCLVQNWSPEMS